MENDNQRAELLNAKQIHIAAPVSPLYQENWVEQILGSVVKPIYDEFGAAIKWMWVTRYSNRYSAEAPPLGYPFPDDCVSDGNYRFVVWRVSASPSVELKIQESATRLITNAGCHPDPKGWHPYDIVGDLGNNRWIRPDATPDQRANRALLVAQYVGSAVRLMLDSLTLDSYGHWVQEPNLELNQNAHGSFMESAHHVFCNATAVPTSVIIGLGNNEVRVLTHWMHQQEVIAIQPDGQIIRSSVPSVAELPEQFIWLPVRINF
ncbi:MAG: hypothetical protein SFU56_20755 [Capsulimonadales bacterium]|nr:hypothetical protein [Capsulimonadales bacterium]